MKRALCGLAMLVASWLPAGATAADLSATQVAQQAWWPGYLAQAQQVKLPDGRLINLYCEGQGAPVVVLDSGLGDSAYSWSAVQDRLAQRTRVCAYDRAGYGKSTLGPEPRDAAAMVADLSAMLRAAHIRGPYVLVGHSLGSFGVRLFAFTHPKDVAGMVLVDPSADWQFVREGVVAPKMLDVIPSTLKSLRACAAEPRPADLEKRCGYSRPTSVTPEIMAFLAETHGITYFKAQAAEEAAADKADSEQLVAARLARGARPLGDKPLIVLTRGDGPNSSMTPKENEDVYKIWVTMHDELAALSSRGVNRIVPGSNHHIQDDHPQVVIDAVFEVVDAVRKTGR